MCFVFDAKNSIFTEAKHYEDKTDHRSFIMFGAVSVQMLYQSMETMDNMDMVLLCVHCNFADVSQQVRYLLWIGDHRLETEDGGFLMNF